MTLLMACNIKAKNIYEQAMSGLEAIPMDDYQDSQFAITEDTYRKGYQEDYKGFTRSIASEAYNARKSAKAKNRQLGMSGLKSGRQEKISKLNKEAYQDRVANLRYDMENKRTAAEANILAQRQAYSDDLANLYSIYLGEQPGDVEFDFVDAYQCIENGGTYNSDGTCTSGPAPGDFSVGGE